MANSNESLEAKVAADTSEFNKKIGEIPKAADKAFTEAAKSVDKFNGTMDKAEKKIDDVKKKAASAGSIADPAKAAAAYAAQEARNAERRAAAAASMANLEKQKALPTGVVDFDTTAPASYTSVLMGVATAAGMVAVAVGAAAVAAAGLAAKLGVTAAVELAAYNDRLKDMSNMVGISVSSLSALDHVFRLSGSSVEEFQMIMVRLNDRIQDAAGGNKAMGRIFKDLGVDVKDGTDKVKPTLSIFLETTDALAKLGAGSKQTSLAFDLFGQRGVKLLTIINQGPGAVKELMEEAKRMGLVLDGTTTAATERYIKTTRELGEKWRELKMIMGREFLPAFTALIEALRQAVESESAKKVIDFWKSVVPPSLEWISRRLGNPAAVVRGKLSDVEKEITNRQAYIDKLLASKGKSGVNPEWVQGLISRNEKDLLDLKGQRASLLDAQSELGASAVDTSIKLDREGGAIRDNTALTEKWEDMVHNLNKSLQDQIDRINEQTIALKRGEDAAKDYALRQSEIDAIEKARKDGAPAAVIDKIRAAYDKFRPAIVAVGIELRKLKYEMDQLDAVGRAYNQDSEEWGRAQGEVQQVIDKTAQSLEDLRQKQSSVEDGVRRQSEAFRSMFSTLDDGQSSIQGYRNSIIDMERSTASLLANAKKELLLNNFDMPGLEQYIAQLEAMLNKIRSLMRDGGASDQAYAGKVASDIANARKRELSDMLLILDSMGAITREERIRAQVLREIDELKRKGVDILKQENAERLNQVEAMATVKTDLADIIRRQQELFQTIERAADSAIDNMQTAFADMFHDIFNPREGESVGRNFMRSILEGMSRAASQLFGVVMTSLMEQAFGAITESMGMGKMTMKGGLTKLIQSVLGDSFKLTDKENETVAAAASMTQSTATFDSSVWRFSAAVDKFMSSTPMAGPGDSSSPIELDPEDVFDEDDWFEDIEGLILDAGDSGFNNVFDNLLSRITSELPGQLGTSMNSPLQPFLSLLRSGLQGVMSFFSSLLTIAANSFISMMGSSGGGGGGGWMSYFRNFSGGGGGGGGGGGMIGDFGGFGGGDFGGFAVADSGGVFNRPTIAMLAANSQPEAVIPLNSMMARKAGSQVISGGNDSGGAPNFTVRVQYLGDIVDPKAQGMTPEESIRVWIEDYKNGGDTRSIMRRDPSLSTR